MNKKLLAAAVAATVVAAPAAFAESVVYGKFHTSVDSNDFEDRKENWSMESRASRLGFKGSEDLGNGLKAIYQAEFSVQTDGNDGGQGQDGGDGWGGQRNTFIGLSGGFGTFLVGRHDTPAKVAFYAAGTEMLGDSIIDLNLANGLNGNRSDSAPIGVFSEYRADNAIAYVSPNFAGFTVAAAVIPGEDSGVKQSASTSTTQSWVPVGPNTNTLVTNTTMTPAKKNDRDSIADHYSIGAMYGGNNIKVGAGYTSYDPGEGGDDMDQMQIGGSFNFDAFTIGAHYESTDNMGFVKDLDYTAWGVVGKFSFGNNAIAAVYTDGEYDPKNGKNTSIGGWGVEAEHNFSKRTKAYVAYADGETDAPGNSDDQDKSVFSLGMIHSF